jgi:hypothetical protein
MAAVEASCAQLGRRCGMTLAERAFHERLVQQRLCCSRGRSSHGCHQLMPGALRKRGCHLARTDAATRPAVRPCLLLSSLSPLLLLLLPCVLPQ